MSYLEEGGGGGGGGSASRGTILKSLKKRYLEHNLLTTRQRKEMFYLRMCS